MVNNPNKIEVSGEYIDRKDWSMNRLGVNQSSPIVTKAKSFSSEESPTKSVSQGLWQKGVLVQIQGGVWSMETRLQPDDLNMENNQIPGFALLGKKRLLDPKHKNEFLNIIGKARSAAERLGFNFVLTGSYFVPFGNFEKLKEIVSEQRTEFYYQADSFVARYAERRAEYLEKYSEYLEKLMPWYPEPEKVRASFKFNAVYYVASMSGMLSEDNDTSDLYLDWAMGAMNSLRLEARDVADAVKNATLGGTLDGRTMRRVQTLIDRLQNMDMLEDSKLRGAALALAADATEETAENLKTVAIDVERQSIRAILLD